uniref:Ependymin-like 1 n=1 Tax=Myripristis murdjan TaxID=586833 RepID=A0A667Z4A9_9TELE
MISTFCSTVVPPLLSGGFSYVSIVLRIKYDAFGQRVLVRNLVTAGNHTFSVEHLMLFKQNVYYEMDWSRFSCQKKKLDPSFIPMQVPADANHMGQVVIGSLSSWGMGVTVNTWYGALPPNGMYMHVFTDAGCFPATLLAFTPESGWTAVRSVATSGKSNSCVAYTVYWTSCAMSCASS